MVTTSVNTFAQVEKVEIAVKGLSCAFCAYGLEKKLKGVAGVSRVTISVEKGVSFLEPKTGESISLEDLKPSITQAGFTPGNEIRATLVGKVVSKGPGNIFTLENPRELFILEPNRKMKQLIGAIKEKAGMVRITGIVTVNQVDGHKNHPYSIALETFEVLP